MGRLEDALRQTFARQVATPPGTEGLADRAIRRAGVIRRRRLAMASVAAVVCMVLVGVGVFSIRTPLTQQFGARPDLPPPVPAASSPAPLVGVTLPIDVLNGDRIQVADGRVVSLAGLGTVAKALRVDPGWLVQTNGALPNRSAVWLVDEKGFASQLAEGDATMVSPGTLSRPEPQVAWVSAGRLSVSNFVGDGLTGTASTPGVQDLVPVRAVGAGILLNGAGAWDMWFPDKGAYKRTTANAGMAVLGVTVDSGHLLARYANQPTCLSEVEPEAFVVGKSACGIRIGVQDQVYASPGGRWWLVITSTDIAVYDAESFWSKPVPAYTVAGETAVDGAWLDDSTFVVLSQTDVIQVSMKDRSVQATAKVPESGLAGPREIVVDLR